MDNKNLTLKWTYTLGNNKIVFERGKIEGYMVFLLLIINSRRNIVHM